MNHLIVGAGGQGKVVADILESCCTFGNIYFFDDVKRGEFAGYEIKGTIDDLGRYAGQNSLVYVAVGDNYQRKQIVDQIDANCPDVIYGTAIHREAIVSHTAKLGAGCVVMAGAIIAPGCWLAPHCIVNTRASLDHDGAMQAFSSLAPGVVCGGNVSIGYGSAICIGAVVREKVNIGSDVIIGAGSLVLNDVPDDILAFGLPLERFIPFTPGQKYLR